MKTVYQIRSGAGRRRKCAPAAILSLACLMAVLAGCATVGREFPAAGVQEIRIGETTQTEIEDVFGPPWRVGIEDGRRTWTYGRYRYRLFGETSTKDLVIRFDAGNRVVSYTFNTTDRDEVR